MPEFYHARYCYADFKIYATDKFQPINLTEKYK